MNRRDFLRLGAGATLWGTASSVLGRSPGVSPLEIRLGTSLGLTGPDGPRAYDYLRGFVTRLNHANAAGGVHGRRLTLLALDDGGRADRVVRNTLDFLDDSDVFCLAAYGNTASVSAMLPLLYRGRFSAGRPPGVRPPGVRPPGGRPPGGPEKDSTDPLLFGAMSGSRSLFAPPYADRVWNLRPSFADEAEALADHLLQSGRRRIAVCYAAGPTGRAQEQALRAALTARSAPPVLAARCHASTVAPAFDALREQRPDAVILAVPTRQVLRFLNRSLETRFTVPLALPSTVEGHRVLVEGERRGMAPEQELVQSRVVPLFETLRRQVAPLVEQPAELPAAWRPAGRPVEKRPSSAAAIEGFLTARALIHALDLAGPGLDRRNFRDSWGVSVPEQPAPERPAPEQPAPERPAPEQPAPERPAPDLGEAPAIHDAETAPPSPDPRDLLWKTEVVLARAVDGRWQTLRPGPATA